MIFSDYVNKLIYFLFHTKKQARPYTVVQKSEEKQEQLYAFIRCVLYLTVKLDKYICNCDFIYK